MKKRKMVVCVLAGALAAAMLCTSCDLDAGIPELSSSSEQTASLSSQEEEESEKKPLKDREVKQIGDTVEYTYITYGDDMPTTIACTVQKVEIFDNWSDTEIPEDDFLTDLLNENQLVLLEAKIKKVSGPEKKEDSWNSILDLSIINDDMKQDMIETYSFSPADVVYFSGYSESNESYYNYWLDPGEEEVFQVGYQVNDPVFERGKKSVSFDNLDGLALYVSHSSSDSRLDGTIIDLSAE